MQIALTSGVDLSCLVCLYHGGKKTGMNGSSIAWRTSCLCGFRI